MGGLFFLAFLFSLAGCASTGSSARKIREKKLFIQATFAGDVDPDRGAYWLAFESDGDASDAPFFSGENLLNTDFYLSLENAGFTKVTLQNNRIEKVEPFTTASFSGKIIQYSVPLSAFTASVVDIGFFTFSLENNTKVLVDGLFDPRSDAQALHFDVNSEQTRTEADPDEGLPKELAFLDLVSLQIQVVTE